MRLQRADDRWKHMEEDIHEVVADAEVEVATV